MSKNSINWLFVLEEDLHPIVLKANTKYRSGSSDYSDRLKNQIQTFRSDFVRLISRSRQESKVTLMQIINVSNVVHHYLTGMAGAWNKHLLSNQIRQVYNHTLIKLEGLIEYCGKFDQRISSVLPLTTYSISDFRIRLRQKFNALSDKISKSETDIQLSELILSGLKQLIGRRELKRSEAEYASLILDQLDKLALCSTFEVENLLYQYDFNTPAFFNYCIINCNSVLMDTPSLHEQMEILIGFEDRINGLPPRTALRWMPEDISIREQLRVFLKEKKAYLQQRMELRRSEIEDHKLSEDNDRMEVNVPVTQLGLLVRLFMERGILPKEDVGRTFAHYARHYRTPKTSFISAESLQKKSTNIEYSTANKVKGHLIGMVNWLNEHHNTNRDKDRTS